MIRDLVSSADPILTAPAQPFDFSSPSIDPVQLAKDLAETLIQHQGLGLAAPQIGVPYRVFAINGTPIHVCYNPKLIDVSSEEIYLEEGCLSFPGLVMKVKRPRHIKLRYTMPNGETVTEKYTGMTARCILHEMDHLDGVLFQTRATLYHREKAMKKWRNVRS